MADSAICARVLLHVLLHRRDARFNSLPRILADSASKSGFMFEQKSL